jgi:tetratricopeptide (TPR) repeat protein
VWYAHGPSAGLALKRSAADFAADRGLRYLEKEIRAEALWLLYDAGEWDELLGSAADLLPWDREHGSSRVTMIARSAEVRVLVSRGRIRDASAIEKELLVGAVELGDAQDLVPTLTAAAAIRYARGEVAGAVGLLDELEQRTRGRDTARRVQELPLVSRICVAGGALAIVEAFLPSGADRTFARSRHCVQSSGATLAEARGELAAALDQYQAAAVGWRAFGNLPEEAHALLGRARCLRELGRRSDAIDSARDARRIARKLGARPLVAEVERFLAAFA